MGAVVDLGIRQQFFRRESLAQDVRDQQYDAGGQQAFRREVLVGLDLARLDREMLGEGGQGIPLLGDICAIAFRDDESLEGIGG